MPSLSLFLYGVAKRLQLPSFQAHYAKDFPAVTDTALAMTRFGSRSEGCRGMFVAGRGYGAWLWQNDPGAASAHRVLSS